VVARFRTGSGAHAKRHVLIIVQNLPVPFDRRVWLECRALIGAGYDVSVVCPKGPSDPDYEVIEGVEIYKYRPYPAGTGKVGYLFEYVYSFSATAWLVAKVWRKRQFHALQACNPPDIFWPLGLLYRMLGGTKFVFDHHDLCPELFESRFPDGPRPAYLALRWLERMTFSSADHVISTNESYRSKALERGSKRPGEVTVVRTGPDAEGLKAGDPDESLRRGRKFLVGYIGVMGPQDGVDIVLRAADKIVHEFGRKDIAFTLIGSGDCYEELLRLRDTLELGEFVEFTGRAPDDLVARILSTADIGLSPDPKNPLNDVSTMNKTMEYMAYGLPVVAFDLVETKVSAQDAADYAIPNEVEDYAAKIVALLDDENRRKEMSRVGRDRIDAVLAWSHQRSTYVGVYDGLLRDGGSATKHDSNVLRLVRSA
jgi:glycosyltransferase involved in cell wall biosynthesis